MRRAAWLLVVVAAVAAAWFLRSRLAAPEPIAEKRVFTGERPPVCPWRNPAADLALLFPGATNYTVDTRILSGSMAQLQKQLGRSLDPDENPLRIYRVEGPSGTNGSILVRRVKGEHGAIELVIGVNANATVQGVVIQTQREPDPIAAAITNWLPSLKGRTVSNVTSALEVPAEARTSVTAIAQAVWSELLLLDYAEKAPIAPHH